MLTITITVDHDSEDDWEVGNLIEAIEQSEADLLSIEVIPAS